MEKARRGFAAMPPDRQRELASRGGKAAHRKGTGHEWTVEEARRAGSKGGTAGWNKRRQLLEDTVKGRQN